MFASRFFVSFLAMSAFGAYASPAPVEVEKRATDVADVMTVMTTLQSSTAAIIPQLNALVSSNKATQASVTPLASQLVTAFNKASSSLNGMSPVRSSTQSDAQQVANSISSTISDVSVALDAVQVLVPELSIILAELGLGVAINEVLIGLNIVIAGVLTLVSGLLFTVSGILTSLGFVLLGLTLVL